MKSYRELLIKVLPHSKWCVVPTVKWSGENGSPCVCAQLIKISLELARVDDTERLPQDGILEGHFFILSSLHSPSLSLSPPLSLSISLFIFYIEVSGAVTGFWYKGWHKVRHVGTHTAQSTLDWSLGNDTSLCCSSCQNIYLYSVHFVSVCVDWQSHVPQDSVLWCGLSSFFKVSERHICTDTLIALLLCPVYTRVILYSLPRSYSSSADKQIWSWSHRSLPSSRWV